MLPMSKDALRWILNLSDMTGKIAPWRLRFTKYESEIIHRAEMKHPNADSLSRLPTDGSDSTILEAYILVRAVFDLISKTWLPQELIQPTALTPR